MPPAPPPPTPAVRWGLVAGAAVFCLAVAAGGTLLAWHSKTPQQRATAAAPTPKPVRVAAVAPAADPALRELGYNLVPVGSSSPVTAAHANDTAPPAAHATATPPPVRTEEAPAASDAPLSALTALLHPPQVFPTHVPAGENQPAAKPAARCANTEPSADAASPYKTYGTAVRFVDSPEKAAKMALKDDKLLFVLHVAGNFEDDKFT